MGKRRKKKKMPDVMNYNPPHQEFDGYLQAPDDQPGLPSIHSVNKATTQGRGKLWGQMHEEPMKSRSILEKIDDQLYEELLQSNFRADSTSEVLDEMLGVANNGFRNMEEFKNFLTEGTMFNVTKLASTYLGLPAGEYVVYNIGPKAAMLMPTKGVCDDVFSESPKPIEVHINSLLGIWDKTERTIAEEEGGSFSGAQERFKGRTRKRQQQTSHSKYPDRKSVVGSFEAAAVDQEALATHCGVHPSMISRLKRSSGEGSRVPGMELAQCIAGYLGSTVDQLWGDVGSGTRKKKHGTSGGGKGTDSPYQSGASNESLDQRMAALEEESNRRLDIVENHLDPDDPIIQQLRREAKYSIDNRDVLKTVLQAIDNGNYQDALSMMQQWATNRTIGPPPPSPPARAGNEVDEGESYPAQSGQSSTGP